MEKLITQRNLPVNLHLIIGASAIATGGLVSAFLAHQPNQTAMWASAYLVLVTGLAQVIFGICLYLLARPATARWLWAGLVAYNLGNTGVLLGTLYKTSGGWQLTIAGGAVLAISLLCMVAGSLGARHTKLYYGFITVLTVILVSIPIGLYLSVTRG